MFEMFRRVTGKTWEGIILKTEEEIKKDNEKITEIIENVNNEKIIKVNDEDMKKSDDENNKKDKIQAEKEKEFGW